MVIETYVEVVDLQAVKNGIKCTLRTPGKTVLFLLILTVVAALLAVSFSVFAAVRGYLDDADGYFHTIAELKYVGRDYPDPFVFDEAAAEAAEENAALLERLMQHEAVISFEPAEAFIAVSDSLRRWDDFVRDPDAAVLDFHVVSYDKEQDVYTALVNSALYSRKDFTGRLILMSAESAYDGKERLETGKDYIIAGKFYKGSTGNPWFGQSPLSYIENGETVTVSEPILSADSYEDDVYHRLAKELSFRNNSVRVTYTSNVEDQYPFHQQILKLSSGRFFTEEEYETKARVIIVSERISGLLGLEVGDKIAFDVYGANGDIYSYSALEKRDSGEYEIVGVHAESESFPYRVFMPDKSASERGITNVNGYTLGQFRLKNGAAASFAEDSAELFDLGFRLNVFDQGYAAATEPMRELLFISVIFLAVCVLLAICALALQSHLFVSRQRDAALTMHALGSGRPHIYAYFLSASQTLAALAAVLGCVIGKLLEGRVFGLLKDFASRFVGIDTRFSSGGVALTRTLEFAPSSDARVYVIAALALVVISAALTLVFASGALRVKAGNAKKKRAETKRAKGRAAKTSKLSGFFKYGLLSVRRGRLRTLAVIVMCAAAAVFFVRLTASLDGYRNQLEAYKASAEISCCATDFNGHSISGLVLKSGPITKLGRSDLIDDSCVTTNFGHLMFIEDVGETYVEFNPPVSSFSYDTMFDKISAGPSWTGVSSILDGPLFHYSKIGEVEWLDGWSEDDFKRVDVKEYEWRYWDYRLNDYSTFLFRYFSGPSVCALSSGMMDEYGIKLGDTLKAVNAYDFNGSPILTLVEDIQVVARYTSQTKSTEVFSPSTYVPVYRIQEAVSPADIEENEDGGVVWIDGQKMSLDEYNAAIAMGVIPGLTYSSFTFKLSESTRLDELRDELAASGFTTIRSVDRISIPLIIEDEVFLNTTRSMERQIEYVTALYWALYIIAGIIGFTLAWLLTASRRQEIALMRALGTQKLRIILNFFAEQVVLAALGLGLGLLVSLPFGGIETFALMLSAAFFILWCLAALVCLAVSLLKKSYAALTEPE